MPIYVYTCPECGWEVEVLQRGSIDPEKLVTPTCTGGNGKDPHDEKVMEKTPSMPARPRVRGGTPKFHK